MWGQNSDVLTNNDFDPAPPCRPRPAPPDFFWTDCFGLILLILAETRLGSIAPAPLTSYSLVLNFVPQNN